MSEIKKQEETEAKPKAQTAASKSSAVNKTALKPSAKTASTAKPAVKTTISAQSKPKATTAAKETAAKPAVKKTQAKPIAEPKAKKDVVKFEAQSAEQAVTPLAEKNQKQEVAKEAVKAKTSDTAKEVLPEAETKVGLEAAVEVVKEVGQEQQPEAKPEVANEVTQDAAEVTQEVTREAAPAVASEVIQVAPEATKEAAATSADIETSETAQADEAEQLSELEWIERDKADYAELDADYRNGTTEAEYLALVSQNRKAEGLRSKLKEIKAARFAVARDYSKVKFRMLIVSIALMLACLACTGFTKNPAAQVAIFVVLMVIILAAIGVMLYLIRKERDISVGYYIEDGSDFVTVTESKKYTVVYSGGKGFEVSDEGVKAYSREDFLKFADGKGAGLASFIYAPEGYLSCESKKNGGLEKLLYFDDFDFESDAKIANGVLQSINSLVPILRKNGKKPAALRLFKFPETVIHSLTSPEFSAFRIPLNKGTVDKIREAGYEFADSNRIDYYEANKVE